MLGQEEILASGKWPAPFGLTPDKVPDIASTHNGATIKNTKCGNFEVAGQNQQAITNCGKMNIAPARFDGGVHQVFLLLLLYFGQLFIS